MPRPKVHHIQPSKEDLELAVRSRSLSAAARKFCGNASTIGIIRKWCKEYGIPHQQPQLRRKSWAIPRPTRDQLETKLQTTATIREVAEHFDVTCSTVYKWIRYFNLRR